MRQLSRIALSVLWLGLSLPARASEPLKFVSDENAPFASTDAATQTIAGITVDMVAEAARRAELPNTMALYPWARAYWLAQNDADTCVFPVARLAQRESLFQWVGPLSRNTWVLYARKDFRGTLGRLDDAKKYKVGGLVQDGPSVYLQSKGVYVDLVGTNELNLQKLRAGRIDLWATGYFRGKLVARKGNVPGIKPVFVIREVDHYLACNLNVPAHAVKAMNEAVEGMWQDGWMKHLNELYQRESLN
jgi:polar amino acid transport system substrate-binding protein